MKSVLIRTFGCTENLVEQVRTGPGGLKVSDEFQPVKVEVLGGPVSKNNHRHEPGALK